MSPSQLMADELAGVVKRTVARGGKVIIPSFALERAQEIVYELKLLRHRRPHPTGPRLRRLAADREADRRLPTSPECYDEAARELLRGHDSLFEFEGLKYVSDVEESKAIDAETEPRSSSPPAACARPGACSTT